MHREPRHDWTTELVEDLYHLPLTELLFQAQTVHRRYHDPETIQRCTLLSIKTGGCPEDCAYCPQSARYDTGVGRERMMEPEAVLAAARQARDNGSTRFCMGAAWREVHDGPAFDAVLSMVEEVAALGMEVCTTLGMLTADQARRLKSAGLTAYNHNLDTSPEFYPKIITTRTYQERLDTLQRVHDAGISVCCGGIVGMGESARDRCALLAEIGRLAPHPESLPVNVLVRTPGTPLAGAGDFEPIELVRTVASARLVAPAARVRLSAGRLALTAEAQALCFLAGANSIFSGEKLLTSPNPSVDDDRQLIERLGLRFQA
ncbi:MAG TPA: biotin synthase BioB [Vicinamibacterales bacterium]|jgi:biotin synthase|nr:biotin synthase BioB [Vicinamibacterales bacterium]